MIDARRILPVSDVPDLAAHIRALGFLTPDEAARLHAIEQAAWVLVRIDGEAERWRCSRCGGKHAHFTRMCIERPFRGLREGLAAYWHNVGAANRKDLSPRQRLNLMRLDGIGFGDGRSSPLVLHHPEMARRLATPETDVDFGAFVLGVIDPIDDAGARKRITLINARAGRTVIRPGPEPLPPLRVFPGR